MRIHPVFLQANQMLVQVQCHDVKTYVNAEQCNNTYPLKQAVYFSIVSLIWQS